jgi:hypothetical protein
MPNRPASTTKLLLLRLLCLYAVPALLALAANALLIWYRIGHSSTYR